MAETICEITVPLRIEDRQSLIEVNKCLLEISRVPIWEALGRFLQDWANWVLGDQQIESAEMRQGIERLHELGQGFYRPYLRGLLAEAHADEGNWMSRLQN
jgi:hypothetical protein